ncbi:FG-GAP-like repeat-containing protein [Streptomyces sp. YS415]|uniref:FG-GAP-like repeat-containing protein n=1 Tax=Streptomyces sp. YS415 TaxID=2944806 RepID=UPI002020B2F0|nr:FG-GAP-like repeat-containing protein [Streptomyces sp. YS415]MCL7430049.1 FG-GAP-like repeat-containing protein [Streptomyces sp. YS415]
MTVRAAATAGVLALGLGLTPMLASQAAAEAPAQVDVTPNWRALPRADSLGSFGTSGFVHSPEDADPHSGQEFQWTRFDTGETTTLLGHGNNDEAGFAEFGVESDYVAHHHLGWIDIRNMADGTARRFTVPHGSGDLFKGLVGGTVLVQDYTDAELQTVDSWYLLPADNPVADAKVTVTGWPEGTDLRNVRLVAGDSREAVVRFTGSTGDAEYGPYDRLGLIDLRTGQLRTLLADTGWTSSIAVAGDRLLWIDTERVAHVRSRSDLDAPERTFPVPADLDISKIGLLDGWLLAFTNTEGTDAALQRNLVAVSFGQERRILLEKADKEAVQIAGGGVAVIGGTSSADWYLQKATVGEDGLPRLEKVRRLAPVAADIDAIALSAGTLSTVETDGPQGAGFYHRTVSPAQAPTAVSAPVWAGRESGRTYDYTACGQMRCTQLFNSGDGRSVYQVRTYESGPAQVEIVGRRGPDQADRALTGDFDGWLTDSTGRYAVYQSGRPMVPGMPVEDGKTIVVDLGTGSVVDQRAQTGATVWGATLYAGTATAGTVATKDLATGKDTGPLDTGAPCVPVELQSAGPWLYWTCEQFRQHGVVNVRTGAKIALPAGRGGLLGDGYFVNQRYTGSNLRLTEFQNGTAVTRDLGIPMSVDGSDTRRRTWAVDRFGGGIAYVDKENVVHVVASGVNASPLTATQAVASAAFKAADTWKASWQLSKPAASWKLTLASANGAVVRTLAGGEVRGAITAVWDGKNSAGSYAPNGTYSWTLVAQPADGQGPPLGATGKLALSGGAAVRHDHVGGDGIGDLLTLNSSGGLTFHRGTGSGKFGEKLTGTGWPTTVKAVPFGDLSGDRCNDVLVRYSSGALRLYKPGCGSAVKPSTPYTTLASSGWTQYDVLTSPGDLSGDGRPDLLARNASTGAVYLYKGTSTGKLAARVKLYDNWKTYKKIVGVGDITGDGKADLLAQDKTNTLYRYDGKGDGTFASRVKLFSNWGGSYNTVVGVGDVTGDGRADLVSRDTSGYLWRNSGDGKGFFGSRTKIATGWQGYKGIF